MTSRYWEEKVDIPSLLTFEPSPPPTSLAFVRSGLNGHVTGYTEVFESNQCFYDSSDIQ